MANNDHHHGIIAAPWGVLGYVLRDGALTSIDFLSSRTTLRSARDALGRRVESQLQRFFKNPAAAFDLPLQPEGTEFQQRVWSHLQNIAPGEPCTYGELARRLGSGARAVGGACRANPIPIVIPCHRVVAASDIGGYCGLSSGRMRRIKQWLLANEGVSTGR